MAHGDEHRLLFWGTQVKIGACLCRSQRRTLGVLIYVSPPYSLECRVLSLNLPLSASILVLYASKDTDFYMEAGI